MGILIGGRRVPPGFPAPTRAHRIFVILNAASLMEFRGSRLGVSLDTLSDIEQVASTIYVFANAASGHRCRFLWPLRCDTHPDLNGRCPFVSACLSVACRLGTYPIFTLQLMPLPITPPYMALGTTA